MADKRRYSNKNNYTNVIKVFKKEHENSILFCFFYNQIYFVTCKTYSFFTVDEIEFKKDFIISQHESNGHADRNMLLSLLKTKAYGITRNEVLAVLKSYEMCQSHR
ncbi:hypothetical protein NGRA_3537 [Nosema granulosis]|uniref:Uncharacterized protein n=1 Tax=Nosema granulosis TaxID=83296 RepID=A0A9P6KWN7_9MICR|nr:hypothetical protein NGRA_3537 [Nosema granulosis]